MNWTLLDFGRYRGKTCPQVAFVDIDWLLWVREQGFFTGTLAAEAEHVARRARRIKVPQREGERMVVEYTVRHRDGKFAVLELVSASHPVHARSFRLSYIDLSVPRSLHRYDKSGGRRIVRDAKFILFGSESFAMTRRLAEDFFANDDNFALD